MIVRGRIMLLLTVAIDLIPEAAAAASPRATNPGAAATPRSRLATPAALRVGIHTKV
jgi:hypothetical protein